MTFDINKMLDTEKISVSDTEREMLMGLISYLQHTCANELLCHLVVAPDFAPVLATAITEYLENSQG